MAATSTPEDHYQTLIQSVRGFESLINCNTKECSGIRRVKKRKWDAITSQPAVTVDFDFLSHAHNKNPPLFCYGFRVEHGFMEAYATMRNLVIELPDGPQYQDIKVLDGQRFGLFTDEVKNDPQLMRKTAMFAHSSVMGHLVDTYGILIHMMQPLHSGAAYFVSFFDSHDWRRPMERIRKFQVPYGRTVQQTLSEMEADLNQATTVYSPFVWHACI